MKVLQELLTLREKSNMAVVFESTIKIDELGKWYIELKDTVDDRVEICKDMQEYADKIQELGNDYGGNIDEVKWSKDDDVAQNVMNEIREEMALQQAQIEEQTGKPLIPEDDK